ncbi:MAG: hypothetical protein U1F83_09600 [Verrucomicrobiota bacterium]
MAATPASVIWVYLDEDSYSLNDGGFGFGMNTPEWIDWPGTYHNLACGFAFADGHSRFTSGNKPARWWLGAMFRAAA